MSAGQPTGDPTRVCVACNEEKPITEFYPTNGGRYRERKCKTCKPRRSREENRQYMREYRDRNPEYVQRNVEQQRRRDVRKSNGT